MEITVYKENLSEYDTGGGYRDTQISIVVDSALSPRLQKHSVIYEVLGALLDPFETGGEKIDELATAVLDALDQLEIEGGITPPE